MNDGDFIKISYEMYVGDDRKLVLTSDEKLARENNIYQDGAKYEDQVLIVGSDKPIKEISDALNKSFREAVVGTDYEIRIEPENAFGRRDPKNIQLHTFRELQKEKINPELGMEVTLKGRTGKIISLTPGRTLIDFNHKWAGKVVFYKYRVNAVISSPTDKILALLDLDYPKGSNGFSVSESGETLEIVVPDDAKFNDEWLESKFNFVTDVRKYVSTNELKLVEVYPKPEGSEASAETGKTEEEKEKQSEVDNKPVEENIEQGKS
ncbi:MAG: peptidylprolyl isomerase [Candidatus Thermoplasmatota archaeon]|jgi:peptidylprolyl isomerase|nr:peptidylprolyl isomerase [Candidatus Thermoplasmatota archaeon]